MLPPKGTRRNWWNGEPETKADASFGELFGEVTDQSSRLVANDAVDATGIGTVRKARGHRYRAGRRGGTAGVVGHGAALAAVIAALALVLPVWASALIVAVVLFGAAGVAALIGKST